MQVSPFPSLRLVQALQVLQVFNCGQIFSPSRQAKGVEMLKRLREHVGKLQPNEGLYRWKFLTVLEIVQQKLRALYSFFLNFMNILKPFARPLVKLPE